MNKPVPLASIRPIAGAAARPAPGIDLTRMAQRATPAIIEMWRVITLRKWWIIFAAVIVTVLALIVASMLVPQYKSTATILFEQGGGKGRVVSIEQVYGGLGSNREAATNQLEFLKSRDVSMRVIRKLGLAKHPDFDPTRRGMLAPIGDWLRSFGVLPERAELDEEHIEGIVLDRFQKRLRVEAIRLSDLVTTTFESSDRHLAATVANELTAAYIQADLDARFAVTQQANEWLNSRVSYLKAKLDNAEAALQDYREKQGLVDTKNVAMGGTAIQLEQLNQQLVEARVRRTNAEQAYRQVRPGAQGIEQVPAIIGHPAVQRARTAEIAAQRRFTDIATRFGPAYPAYQAAELELRAAKETTQREINAVATSIRKEYEAARASELSLEQTLARTRGDVQEINRKEIQQSALEREVEVNKQLYQLFLSRQQETAASSDIQISPARVIDPAIPALVPFSPNLPMIGAGALFVSLMLGAAAVVAWHRIDDTIKRADDIEAQIGLPLIAAVPKLSSREAKAAHKLMITAPTSQFAEAIRSISSGVQLASLDSPNKVLLVTSSIPGEGKSTMSCNLALMQARLRKTLIIEADLRRPVTAGRLGLLPGLPGLAEFVSGSSPLRECVHQVPGGKLWVMPCGQRVPNAAELFATAAFRDAMQSLASEFEYIVIDSAPVRPVSDAQLLSAHVTGVVFVAAANSTPAPLVRMSIKRLTDAGARMFGVVLNRYDFETAEKYYGDYSSYKDYAESPSAPLASERA
ncbi:MAG: polysaccharide biosynthesis tyrosine autokinase [Burkholderiaceae bacterium]